MKHHTQKRRETPREFVQRFNLAWAEADALADALSASIEAGTAFDVAAVVRALHSEPAGAGFNVVGAAAKREVSGGLFSCQ